MRIPAPSRRTLLALGAVGLTLVAGCGTPPAPATAPTVDFGAAGGPTPGMDGMSGMPGMAAPAPTPAAAPSATNAVQITGFAFAPATITIPVGTTVTWTNSDEEPHTVTASGGAFRSPGMGTGATYAFTFSEPGTFDYICTIHPFMHGTVTVTP